MSTPVDTSRHAYAERVRAALADLPAAERDDLLAELDEHLAEVASELPEGGGTLAERLGPPEAYAAELRAAAGLPPAPAAGPPGWRGPLAGLDLRRAPRAALDFLPELRPGWWVLRALLLAWFLGMYLLDSVPALVLAALVAVPASIALGRREAADRRVRRAVLLATLLVAAGLVFQVVSARTYVGYAVEYPADPVYGVVPGLDGVTNLHPYSSDGKPLTDVLLYDQDGNPVVLTGGTDANGNAITVVPRYTRDGRVVPNLYPQEQTVEDYTAQDPDTMLPGRRRVPAPTVTPPTLQPR